MEENIKMGFIKFYRSIVDWEWYTDSNTMRLFIHCLLKANHTTKDWQGITIQSGSFITSYAKLAQELNLTEKQIRIALNKLKRTGEVAHRATSRNSIITVKNYKNYQGEGRQEGSQRAVKGQAEGSQRATTNKLKNERIKEINNIIIGHEEKIEVEQQQQSNEKRFKKPTIEEIKSYCSERKNNIDAEYFFNYYESKGWKIGKTPMKNWKSAVITWERKDFSKDGDNNAGNTADVRKNPNESKYSRANGWF